MRIIHLVRLQSFPKNNISYPLVSAGNRAYHEVTNVANVLNESSHMTVYKTLKTQTNALWSSKVYWLNLAVATGVTKLTVFIQ